MSEYGSDWPMNWKKAEKAKPLTWEDLYAAYTESRGRVMGPVEFQVSMADIIDRLPVMSPGQIWHEATNGGYARAATGEYK